MPQTSPQRGAVSIDPRLPHVLLRPEDDDLFVRTGKQVIEACRLSISIDLWLNELRSMFALVRQWAEQRNARVRACHAVFGSRIALFFVPRSQQFDFDLADELAELNSQVVKQFNIGMIEVRQIPWAEMGRFVDPASARCIYGDGLPAHPPVEA